MFTQKMKSIILNLINKLGVFLLGAGIMCFFIGLTIVEFEWKCVFSAVGVLAMFFGAGLICFAGN